MHVAAIVLWLAAHGCQLPCAAGIIANLEVESHLDPGAVSRSGIGLAQWAGHRRSRLLATLGRVWHDPQAQLAFMLTELGEMDLLARLFAAHDPTAAARLFMLEFERPRHRFTAGRERRAVEIWREFSRR